MQTQKQGLFSDAPVISVYTRAQAIDDGFLVDVSDSSENKEIGFKFPVSLTRAVWDRYVEVPAGVPCQDLHGRLFDLLNVESLEMLCVIGLSEPHGGRLLIRMLRR